MITLGYLTIIMSFATSMREKKVILDQVHKLAGDHHCIPVVSESLLEEVHALVEWPRAIVGTFDELFLTLPEEVIMSTMQDHQKYFPLRDNSGNL